ncbi:anillin isoform X5 [Scophthalmus maximus]|uniref:anillin isoform X5 n=1 Tax=Scophthalmus maximus TaxID=52904 RepID=UPI001FA83E17|nr:anillin isoform X5 [Scophthalmus maximus]
MEAGEENSGNANLKRQRAPLSDSDENVLSPSGMNDGQKRRRLEAAGQENQSPIPSSSGRLAELGMKPDTPMVPSVWSRVQQLTQIREAPLGQRCLSDPGADSPTAIILDKGFKEHLLGEGEFSQRMERFKMPVFQAGPTLSPASLCPRTHSNLVSGIHQKLQGTTTPSSKQASRMRQEREQELNLLHFQPISENAWLKRSSSDPSLAQQGRTPPGPSSPSSWIPSSRRRVHWPPMQPLDQVDGDVEMRDGSFTEVLTSSADNPPVNTTGERAGCDSEAPAATVELKCSIEGQLHMEGKENTHQSKEFIKESDRKALVGNEEERLGDEEPETVLELSFSEDQSFSKTSFNDEQRVSDDELMLIETTGPHESNKKENDEVSIVREQSRAEIFSFEDETMDDESSYNDEEIEPSTDEECRLWKYPQYKACKKEQSVMSEQLQEDLCAEEEEADLQSFGEEEKGFGSVAGHRDPSDIQEFECCLGDVSAEIAGSSELQEYEKSRPEEDSHKASPFEDVTLIAKRTDYIELQRKTENVAQPKAEAYDEPVDIAINNSALSLTEVQVSGCILTEDMEQEALDERQGVINRPPDDTHKAEGGESLKKVAFVLEPELINDSSQSDARTSLGSRAVTSMSDAELSSHDETDTTEIIDRMFEEVLQYAGRMEEERGDDEGAEDRDSGIGASTGDQHRMDTESEKLKGEKEEKAKEECDESKKLESNGDELLTFPPCGILSPLSKSVEAVVTPLRLAASQQSNPPSLLLTPEDTPTPPVESAPLYSIDAYRTQVQSKLPSIQRITPGAQRPAPEKSHPQRSVNTKERITALNEEAGKLQNVINQTLQALSCCTDEEHGRGSLEEAEAEKLLLVSCEKRSALLAEVSRLREERNSELGEVAGEDGEYVSQQPCRGTISITNIQLPLKVEFVCSSHSRTGRPSHYFFILIRYGPCNIIATPLATATDAQNGDTISFPTSVTLKDIRSSFEIDVEVYSLSHTSAGNQSMDRNTTKSRVTPRKLLNTITQRSSNTLASASLPALNTRRSSNFSLVGSHKITLASLGLSKFPLDKMKLEGKIRRLLGDEFQEKVPFLSPLEGNIYLRLDSQSHSNVQHQGFLTIFELISGYGVWHRRYFVLESCRMYYWNHPNDRETKEAEGSISLSSSPSQCVRPVKRYSCARPFTFELVSNIPNQQQDDNQEALAKCWFSADTKQERLDWMEKLNQVLLDFHTWNRTSATQTESQQSNALSSGNLRESIL